MVAKSKISNIKLELREAAKSSSERILIFPAIKGWYLKKEGSIRPLRGMYLSKNSAIAQAVKLNYQKSSIVVVTKEGKIENLN